MQTVTSSQYPRVSDGGSCLSPQGPVRWVASADSATPQPESCGGTPKRIRS
ncbi:MAG: hypothetical protein ING88_05705 [Cytophagales bacterium]|nr:hypothetical protein [Cytophagales bacterium]MCE2958905.1 hypothetical protein [Flammeovirgaceae bacterium]MCZ8071064.1 hypothetical protein [Cytophagales bacterium]